MAHLGPFDFDSQPINQPGYGSARLFERGSAHDAPWSTVCNAEDYRPTTLIGEGRTILRQSLEMEPASRFLKLQPLPFGFADETLQTRERSVLMVICHYGIVRLAVRKRPPGELFSSIVILSDWAVSCCGGPAGQVAREGRSRVPGTLPAIPTV